GKTASATVSGRTGERTTSDRGHRRAPSGDPTRPGVHRPRQTPAELEHLPLHGPAAARALRPATAPARRDGHRSAERRPLLRTVRANEYRRGVPDDVDGRPQDQRAAPCGRAPGTHPAAAGPVWSVADEGGRVPGDLQWTEEDHTGVGPSHPRRIPGSRRRLVPLLDGRGRAGGLSVGPARRGRAPRETRCPAAPRPPRPRRPAVTGVRRTELPDDQLTGRCRCHHSNTASNRWTR